MTWWQMLLGRSVASSFLGRRLAIESLLLPRSRQAHRRGRGWLGETILKISWRRRASLGLARSGHPLPKLPAIDSPLTLDPTPLPKRRRESGS